MNNGFVETLIGAAVVAVAGVFFWYGWNTTGSAPVGGYELIARFDGIDGINVGTDVRMSGIKIGTVTAQELDQKTYRALVRMNVKDEVKLPDDSSIRVASEGLLGGAYLAVSPGGSETKMAAGSEFETTQGSVDLIGLVSKAIFSGAADSEKKPESSAPPPAPATGNP